jgi:hypothetical protein
MGSGFAGIEDRRARQLDQALARRPLKLLYWACFHLPVWSEQDYPKKLASRVCLSGALGTGNRARDAG